jgi:uncharacterized protein (TIGR03083 family)
MEVSAHVDTLRADGTRLAEAAALAGPDAPVPSCPEWTVRQLLHHQGAVHRWAAAYVSSGLTEAGAVDFAEARGPEPADADLIDWFRSGHATLVTALSDADPDLQCWSFLPAPSPLAFWARRQAHETCIHRVDGELAAGQGLGPIGPAFAADGIDELLVAFGSRRGGRSKGEGEGRGEGEKPAAIAFRCTDGDSGWDVRVGPGGVDATALTTQSKDEGEVQLCTVRGRAADLYLTLWRRRGPDALMVEGDDRAFAQLLERVRI